MTCNLRSPPIRSAISTAWAAVRVATSTGEAPWAWRCCAASWDIFPTPSSRTECPDSSPKIWQAISPAAEAIDTGLRAIADGLALQYADDHALNEAGGRLYDALYTYCQDMIRRGKPEGAAGG